MKIGRQSLAGALFNVLFLIAFTTLAASEEQGGNNWLNGQWEGRPPMGGELTMTLTVEKVNQVRGTAIIPTARHGAQPDVTGTVEGKHVTLETFFPGAYPQSAVHYNCMAKNDVLQCRTKSGYQTTFKRVN